jgi:hypothetical protein
MSSPRTVLIVHPDSQKRRALRELVPLAHVLEAESRQDAVAVLQRTKPSHVLSHHDDFKRLVKDLERHAPGATRAVLCGSDEGVRQALVDVAAQGYDFLTIDDSEVGAVQSVVECRGSARLPAPSTWTAAFDVDGTRITCPVADLGDRGLGLHVAPPAPLERLVPGAQLTHAEVRGPDGLVMEARTWTVQTVVASPSGRGNHLGVSVEAPRPDERASTTTADAVKIGGILRRAAHRSSRFLVNLVSGAEPRSFDSLRVDVHARTLTLTGRGPETFVAGDLLQVSFELAGHQTEFLTVAQAVNGPVLELALPRRLVRRGRRASLRMHFDADERAVVQVRSPLHQGVGLKRLIDLHPAGAAFNFDAREEIYPLGLRLEVVLSIAGRQVAARAVVQSISPAVAGAEDGQAHAKRCGLKLEGLTDADRQVLLDLLVRSLVPDVVDASSLPFSDIWRLFVEHQVRFPDYPPDDPKTLETLTTAHALVGDGRHGLAKSFVYQDKGELVGHASGLRVYSKTWLTQHLLVRSGTTRHTQISHALVNLAFHYGEALSDVEYVRVFWRASNRWPVRVFGALSAKLLQPGVAVLSTFTPFRRPVSAAAFASQARAGLASPADQELLLAHLWQTEDPLRLLADDLVKEELGLESLSARYARAGLARSRSVAVARGADGPRGWVIAERSTPALFWAEWFNAYRLVLVAPAAPDAEEVCRALLAWAQADAAGRGQSVAEVLVPDALVPMMERLAVENLGKVYELTHHRSVAREVTLQLDGIFQRLSEREDRAAHTGDRQ